MASLKKIIGISLRLNLLVSIPLTIIFIVLAILFYQYDKKQVIQNIDREMQKEIFELNEVCNLEVRANLEKAIAAMKTLTYLIRSVHSIKESDTLFEIEIINQYTKEKQFTKIKQWYFNDEPVYNSTALIDIVTMITGASASIYQKTSAGYVLISSNLPNDRADQSIDSYLPNTSAIIETIENGEIYNGKTQHYNSWYFGSYRPFYIGGILKGMLAVEVLEENSKSLSSFFYSRYYLKRGYPFLIDKMGKLLIHPTLEGTDINKSNLFKQISSYKKDSINTFRYLWPENSNGEWKYLIFKYHKDLNAYICASYFENDLFESVNQLRVKFTLGVILLILTVFIVISIILKPFIKTINKLSDTFLLMSQGKTVEKINYSTKDELGLLITSLNQYILGIQNTVKFAKNIKKGDLFQEFQTLSKDDELGNALQEMRQSLIKLNEEEAKRKDEDQIRSWTNEGLSKFVEILRQSSNNLEEFSYHVVSNMVKYLNANQGGVFIINDDESNNQFLEQAATYAYDLRRVMNKKIPLGVSLLSRAVSEKHTIYLTEIPEEYLAITSGLGTSAPKSLVIVPLIFNDKVYGVIEIASFQDLEKYKIDFIEKIGESIASTISSVRISNRTSELLIQSQAQSEKMKAQEKEMRKNLNELQTIQNESNIRSLEMQGVIAAINSISIVIEYSPQKEVIDVNEKFEEKFFISAESAKGRKHSDFSSMKADSEDYFQLWNDLLAGKSKTLLERIQTSKSELWLSQTFTPIKDLEGNITKILNIALDITETKMLERQLRRQVKEMREQDKEFQQKSQEIENRGKDFSIKEKKMQDLINVFDSLFSVAVLDTDGNITSANNKFIEFLNYKINELIGENIRKYIEQEMLGMFNLIMEKVFVEDLVSLETSFVDKNNVSRPLKCYLNIIKNSDDIVEKVIFVGTDSDY